MKDRVKEEREYVESYDRYSNSLTLKEIRAEYRRNELFEMSIELLKWQQDAIRCVSGSALEEARIMKYMYEHHDQVIRALAALVQGEGGDHHPWDDI
jgi:hypothetical protein